MGLMEGSRIMGERIRRHMISSSVPSGGVLLFSNLTVAAASDVIYIWFSFLNLVLFEIFVVEEWEWM